MTKAELMNGDVVATRCGELGVIIKRDGDDYILFQDTGKLDLDLFNDDLTSDEGEYLTFMDIYRGGYSFWEIDVDDPAPDWSRDVNWQRPMTRERELREALWEEDRLDRVEEMRQQEEEMRQQEEKMRDVYISIIGQCCFGSRTKIKIPRSDAKRFISNCISPLPDDYFNDVELRTIPVPGDENIVIVYDKTREDEYINGTLSEHYDDYRKRRGEETPPKETCIIPELGVELHTSCFACRIDKNGVFQSLEERDEELFIDYFTRWWEREEPTEPKYKVGDMVEFTATKGGFDEIEGCGKIVMVGRDRYDGRNKYLTECYNKEKKRFGFYAFYDSEIAGLIDGD